MTEDREFWRVTTDWLEAGSDHTPPRAVDAVLLAVRSSRQERPLPVPWRPVHMQILARALIAAAAVVAIGLTWFNLSPSDTGVGGVATPAPTVVPSPTPTPLPIPSGTSNPGSPLQAGARYVTTDPFPVRLSFVAPAGWAGNVGGPYAVWAGPAATGDAVSFQLSAEIYADPCHPEQGPVTDTSSSTGRSTDMSYLAEDIVSRPGLAPATPSGTTLGGLPATTFRLMLKAPSPRDCTNGTYVLWRLPLGATNELQPDMSERIWLLRRGGYTLIVTADDAADSQAQQAIQEVLDSIRFEPAG